MIFGKCTHIKFGEFARHIVEYKKIVSAFKNLIKGERIANEQCRLEHVFILDDFKKEKEAGEQRRKEEKVVGQQR